MTYCNTPESFWNNSKEIDNLLVYGQWTRTNCNHCQRQCHQDFYIAYTEMTKMKPTENKISKLRVFYQVFFTEKSFLSLYHSLYSICRISRLTRSKRVPTMEPFLYSAILADHLVSCSDFPFWLFARLSTPSFKLVYHLCVVWSTNAEELNENNSVDFWSLST